MADLPEDRVESILPFTYCVALGRSQLREEERNWRYIVIFTCMSSRAVHIEQLDDTGQRRLLWLPRLICVGKNCIIYHLRFPLFLTLPVIQFSLQKVAINQFIYLFITRQPMPSSIP